MNTKNLLTLQSILLFLLIVVVALGSGLPYIIPPRTATNTVEVVPTQAILSTPTSVPSMSTAIPVVTPTQWEYLTINYSQYTNYAENPINPRFEIVTVDQEPYASLFSAILYAGCNNVAGDFAAESNCASGNFKGREYFLNVLGQDGWELIQVDNQSSEFEYQVDMLFKRPIVDEM